ncbi:MAG: T9SS type A sorting domain-containing protein, partial [bacterium]
GVVADGIVHRRGKRSVAVVPQHRDVVAPDVRRRQVEPFVPVHVADRDGPDELVYCGTEGGGVARLKISNLDVITGASTIERPWAPIPIDSVYAIYIGTDSLQWFGTTQGLFQHIGIDSKINWKRFTLTEGLPHPRVQTITEDATGKIWAGTPDGVSCIEKNLSSCLNYSMADGLVHNNVRDIVEDTDGSLWFATAGGVSKFPSTTSFVKMINTTIARCFEQISIYPNPFNICTSLEFKLVHPAYTEISIYNLSGQRVRKLWQGHATDGVHVVQWDGRNDQNCVVSTAVYLARFVSGTEIINKKVLVIK